jgi:hypothetical protein
MSKKHILQDDSNLLRSVSQVIAKDTKPIVVSKERLKEKAKGDLNTAIRAVMLEDEQAAIASQDSLRNYPGSNPASGAKTFPVADARYHSDDPYMVPKQEVSPQVGNRGDSASIQKQLIDAAQKVADVWSKLLDPRNRMGINDIQAAKRFLKIAFGSLLSEE